MNGSVAYRGIPYAAPPVGELRWKPPQPAAKWTGVRDGSQFGPSSPQQRTPLSNVGGVLSEDSLYLNVSTPRVSAKDRPVIVWFHGGGQGLGAGRDYEPAKLAAKGAVVVTVNYRLGALGFLAHPALAENPGGPSGNYGLMDQQAALRWVQQNIDKFGGDRRNVTIAGQSSGGLSVLVHLTSPGSRGLFHKAILQSGSFALTQDSHATAEAAGKAFVEKLDITEPTAEQLRSIPVDDLVDNFPFATIPGYVDGEVLQRSVGESLATGQFARVPILQGTNNDEEAVFLTIGLAVSQGRFVPAENVTAENYQEKIASVLGVSAERAAEVAAEYPLSSYGSATQALSVLVGDASFVAGAAQVNSLGVRPGADVPLRVQRRRGAAALPAAREPSGRHPRFGAPVRLRSAGRPLPGTPQRRPGDTREQHPRRMDPLRGDGQPVDEGAALAVCRHRPAGDVAGSAPASTVVGLRGPAPRRVLAAGIGPNGEPPPVHDRQAPATLPVPGGRTCAPSSITS